MICLINQEITSICLFFYLKIFETETKVTFVLLLSDNFSDIIIKTKQFANEAFHIHKMIINDPQFFSKRII